MLKTRSPHHTRDGVETFRTDNRPFARYDDVQWRWHISIGVG